MKTRTSLTATALLLAGVTLLGTFSSEPARGQSAKPNPLTSGSGGGDGGATSGVASAGGLGDMNAVNVRRNKLLIAVKTLRSAKDAAEKSKAKTNLAAVLKDLFDSDLAKRQKEITDIEARVTNLRGVLDKRRAAQDSIIELQIKVLVYEAEGLGFPLGGSSGWRRGMFRGSNFPGMSNRPYGSGGGSGSGGRRTGR